MSEIRVTIWRPSMSKGSHYAKAADRTFPTEKKTHTIKAAGLGRRPAGRPPLSRRILWASLKRQLSSRCCFPKIVKIVVAGWIFWRVFWTHLVDSLVWCIFFATSSFPPFAWSFGVRELALMQFEPNNSDSPLCRLVIAAGKINATN